jgi:diguanylate cyclase (GGDEF)-like protein
MIKHLAKQIEIAVAIHQLYEKAVWPTKYDELTEAYTRRYHRSLLEKALSTAISKKQTLSICALDINNLKEINDQFGHEAGDECLRFFAESVRATITDSMIFSRVGGDEFALAFEHCNAEVATAKIDRLRTYLNAHPFCYQENSKIICFGCGIASYPNDGSDLNQLIRLSDRRMYEDKFIIKAKQPISEYQKY